jgi:hypothetical protein
VLNARVRSVTVAIVCLAIGLRIVFAERAHLLDEMPLLMLAVWAAVAVVAVRISGERFWPQAAAHDG